MLQTGDYDFAWNLQVEPDILAELEQGGKGVVSHRRGTSVERINDQLRRPEHRGRRAARRDEHRQPDHGRQGGPPGAQPRRRSATSISDQFYAGEESSRRPPTS